MMSLVIKTLRPTARSHGRRLNSADGRISVARRVVGIGAVTVALLVLASVPDVGADTTGYLTAGTANGGWTGTFTTANVNTADGVRATTGTQNLHGILSSFGFTLPAKVVVTGVTLEVRGSVSSNGNTLNYAVDL
jgi:hypothetical protein